MIMLFSLLACLLSMIANLFVGLGKLRKAYLLGIANGACLFMLNGLIAYSQDEQRGVAMLMIPSAWLVITSMVGLRRLNFPSNTTPR